MRHNPVAIVDTVPRKYLAGKNGTFFQKNHVRLGVFDFRRFWLGVGKKAEKGTSFRAFMHLRIRSSENI